ncbi:Uncharacterized protein PCOAH_00039070 [Plasmodium coatneyi]|uniref:Thioredoxin domain-containing protein n=1 Tax=Plasmodium coatneyi TaxID=208452 RepID=A0A1B1E374_9APIC|nr:Uncharacterized protein PCOAH_00039070 [Plasmodium coatneyi]ANQ09448.1 Uncharacterized protein PCOAH_00039070 [Plasmodium coatneyi]
MEYLILEEKYKNLLNKSNHEKAVLKKESQALRKKLQNLEGAYIEKEKEVAEILGEKENLEDRLSKMGKENESLEEEIIKLNEKIVDLTDLSKTYRQMIKSRNKELQHSHFLVAENMHLRNTLELAHSEKMEIESELGKKKNIIQLIKNKYKNNIGRLLEKFNEKDRHFYEFQTSVVKELHNLKLAIRREQQNTFYDDSIRDDTILNISHHLDVLNSANSKLLECKEINDQNYDAIIKKRKTFLLYGYAHYSNRCFTHLDKLASLNNDFIQIREDEKLPLYKLNVSRNNFLVRKFHIKSVPTIQLRHKNKLIDELIGNELNEQTNVDRLLRRCGTYFNSIREVDNMVDFLAREEELPTSGYNELFEREEFLHGICPSIGTTHGEDHINMIPHQKDKNNFEIEMKEKLFPKDTLNGLLLKYQCTTYVLFKKLELLLNGEKKNTPLIKLLLNEIIANHSSYLDINERYSKLMAKAFLLLFDEEKLAIEKLLDLKKDLEAADTDSSIHAHLIQSIHFNEPIITFDDFKNIHLRCLNKVDEFLSNETEEEGPSGIMVTSGEIPYSGEKAEIQNGIFKKCTKNSATTRYLSRVCRILAVKYLQKEQYDDAFHHALQSYTLTFPLNNVDTSKSKVLIENLILYLGAYNPSVIKFLSDLQLLFTDKIFKVVRFPHTRAIKGGRPMMKRGKSGKWLWLSQDWKPRWLKKKAKLILEEEWRCVPDKNVPFWN